MLKLTNNIIFNTNIKSSVIEVAYVMPGVKVMQCFYFDKYSLLRCRLYKNWFDDEIALNNAYGCGTPFVDLTPAYLD